MKGKRCLINVEVALAIRDFVGALGEGPSKFLFLCPACKQPVRPNASDNAIFLHLKANPDCPRE